MIHAGRTDLTPIKASMAAITNKTGHTGTIEAAMVGADVFIGLSAGKVPRLTSRSSRRTR